MLERPENFTRKEIVAKVISVKWPFLKILNSDV